MDNAPPQVAGRRRPPEEEVITGACCLLSFVTLRCLSPRFILCSRYLIFCGLTPRTLQSSLMLDFFSLIFETPPLVFVYLKFPTFWVGLACLSHIFARRFNCRHVKRRRDRGLQEYFV